MHLEIPFGYKCNNRCVMCTNPVDGQLIGEDRFNAESIHKFIEKKKKYWPEVDSIYITGGEATVRPDFFDLLGRIANSFPLAKISIISNGRRFFYADFVKKCIAYTSVNFIIPIHGWDSEGHDKVTGIRGSFEQTMSGIENIFSLRQLDQEIEIRIIIHKLNYRNINEIVGLILRKFPSVDRVVLVFIEYEGHAIINIKSIKLSYKDFYPKFKQLEKYLNKFKEIRFYHFPLCAMPKKFWPYMWRTMDSNAVTFSSECSKCKVKIFCLGIQKNYLEIFGGNEFRPLKKENQCREEKFKCFLHPIVSVE